MKKKLLLVLTFVMMFSVSTIISMIVASAESTSNETLNDAFVVNSGTWEQIGDQNDPTKLTDLKIKALDDRGSLANKAAVVSNFGGAYGENFTIKFNTSVPTNNDGNNGFFFRNTKSPFIDDAATGVYVRLDANRILLIDNEGIPGLKQAGFTQAAGTMVTVEISVIDNALTASVSLAGTQLASISKTLTAPYTASAGFFSEKELATFKKITVSNGKDNTDDAYKEFKAYPFAAAPVENEEAVIKPATQNLNANFQTMVGEFKGSADSTQLTATDFHEFMASAVISSKFAKAYGANFEVEFDVTTPTRAAVAAKPEGASAGFYFRQETTWDLYSGIYVRVEKDAIKIINDFNNADNTGTKVLVGKFSERFSQFVTVKISVLDNVLKISLKDKDGVPMQLKTSPSFNFPAISDTTETNVSELLLNITKSYNASHTAGFAADGTDVTFANIKMTGNGKEFLAYPFDPSKDGANNFEIVSNSMTKVALTAGNADVQSNDEDIIGAFPEIFYADYNGQTHTIYVKQADGSALPEGYKTTIEFRAPPTWDFIPWVPTKLVDRHGISIGIEDADGYVYSRLECAFRINPKKITFTGIVATDRAWDGTRDVSLSGGSIVGIVDGDEVTLDLGTAEFASAAVGTNKEIITYISLKGADAANYTFVQPTNITANITKAISSKPTLVLESKTSNSVTVEEIEGAEYKLGDGAWQDSNVFENLTANTEYKIYARIKGTDNINQSEISDPLIFKTEKVSEKTGGCGGVLSSNTMIPGILIVCVFAASVIFIARKKVL